MLGAVLARGLTPTDEAPVGQESNRSRASLDPF